MRPCVLCLVLQIVDARSPCAPLDFSYRFGDTAVRRILRTHVLGPKADAKCERTVPWCEHRGAAEGKTSYGPRALDCILLRRLIRERHGNGPRSSPGWPYVSLDLFFERFCIYEEQELQVLCYTYKLTMRLRFYSFSFVSDQTLCRPNYDFCEQNYQSVSMIFLLRNSFACFQWFTKYVQRANMITGHRSSRALHFLAAPAIWIFQYIYFVCHSSRVSLFSPNDHVFEFALYSLSSCRFNTQCSSRLCFIIW